jgi:glyoxylase-like metal-dependent hydrolase (beta-lactamase superfamily II)
MKRWFVVLSFVVVAIVLGLAAYVVPIAMSIPSTQGARVVVNDDVVGVETGGSYAWIVRTASGAALVDTGMDAGAVAIKAELERLGLTPDDVHTVLLTHAHRDHTGGMGVFAKARVVHGPDEGPLLHDEKGPNGVLPAIFNMLTSPAKLPEVVVESKDGAVLRVDNERVQVIATPGHTAGSASFLWGDVLFTGDALIGNGTGVQLLPSALADDFALNQTSIRSYGALDFTSMADGHVGATADAKTKVDAFLAQ